MNRPGPEKGWRTAAHTAAGSTHAIRIDLRAAVTAPPWDHPPPAHLDGAVVELLGPHLGDAELKAVQLRLVSGVRAICRRRTGFTAS